MTNRPLSSKTNAGSTKTKSESEHSFKGTLISVGFVAAIIIIVWATVFWVYMSRI